MSICNFNTLNNSSVSSGYTQVPNEFFDKILPLIESKAELKILLVIMRHTFGWQNSKNQKNKNKLSFSDFQTLTGLNREAVNNGLKAGIEKGLIKREKFGLAYKYWLILKEKIFADKCDCSQIPKETELVRKPNHHQSENRTITSQKTEPISGEPKETIKKEKETTTTANSKKEKNSSSLPLNRNLTALNELLLSESQKQTLFCQFDDPTILNAIAYYKSQKKEPNNLGAFLFSACKWNWTKPQEKPEKAIINHQFAKKRLGHLENRTFGCCSISILSKGVEFAAGPRVIFINYDQLDFENELITQFNRFKPLLNQIRNAA